MRLKYHTWEHSTKNPDLSEQREETASEKLDLGERMKARLLFSKNRYCFPFPDYYILSSPADSMDGYFTLQCENRPSRQVPVACPRITHYFLQDAA